MLVNPTDSTYPKSAPDPIDFRVGIKIYRTGLLITLEHDNFDVIFILDRYRGAAVLKVMRYVSDRVSSRFDC